MKNILKALNGAYAGLRLVFDPAVTGHPRYSYISKKRKTNIMPRRGIAIGF